MHIFDDRYVTMTRGDTMSFGIEIEGLNQDLETAFFTCRKDLTESPVFQKSIGNGISKVGNQQYAVRIAPEDTANLQPGRYYYDLQLSVNSDVFTILKGVLEIDNDVTREV